LGRDRNATFQIGQIVIARVERVFPFGAFARLDGGTEAYISKRELTQEGNLDPRRVVSSGQAVQARVTALKTEERVLEISIRQAQPDPWDAFSRSSRVRDTVAATVKSLSAGGAFVQVLPGVDGFIPTRELAPWLVHEPGDLLWTGDRVEAMITHLDARNKRLRLSIRRQMLHLARVQALTDHLQTSEGTPAPLAEPLDFEDGEAEAGFPPNLEPLGRVLVVDDHAAMREELVIWLERHNCGADGAGRPDAGLALAQQRAFGLALIDLDLAGADGLELVAALRQSQPGLTVIVMSIPEWLAERSDDLEALAVDGVFVKPLDMAEVGEVLEQLAQGQRIDSFRAIDLDRVEGPTSGFQEVARTTRTGIPLSARLRAGLSELVSSTRAELGVLFRMDPVSHQVDDVARAGDLPLNRDAFYALPASPVKDVIREGVSLFEPQLNQRSQRRCQKLLDVVDFGSCLGVPVSAAGHVEHALFLFHRRPGAFRRYHLRDATATATLLGVAMESDEIESQVQALSPFLLSGQLAAAFGHDVFNKMSALELQARNLRAVAGPAASADQDGAVPATLPGGQAEAQTRGPLAAGPVLEKADRLLETTLDLRETVEAFRELLRDQEEVAMDVNAVVERAAKLLRTTARRNHVTITLDLEPDLPGVMGAPVRLQQAFLNIMLNAVQQCAAKMRGWPKGRGDLVVTTSLDSRAGRVWVRFVDDGPGIHHELWEAIFALGFSTRAGGTGLGLFITRSLVRSMGGTVSVEKSLIPAGTTFRVTLPVG
jgi:signal transduction histidine kinase/predicted RNA-binding protein with RPS1 domain/DNA-binding NarL/FixJ family response regulator